MNNPFTSIYSKAPNFFTNQRQSTSNNPSTNLNEVKNFSLADQKLNSVIKQEKNIFDSRPAISPFFGITSEPQKKSDSLSKKQSQKKQDQKKIRDKYQLQSKKQKSSLPNTINKKPQQNKIQQKKQQKKQSKIKVQQLNRKIQKMNQLKISGDSQFDQQILNYLVKAKQNIEKQQSINKLQINKNKLIQKFKKQQSINIIPINQKIYPAKNLQETIKKKQKISSQVQQLKKEKIMLEKNLKELEKQFKDIQDIKKYKPLQINPTSPRINKQELTKKFWYLGQNKKLEQLNKQQIHWEKQSKIAQQAKKQIKNAIAQLQINLQKPKLQNSQIKDPLQGEQLQQLKKRSKQLRRYYEQLKRNCKLIRQQRNFGCSKISGG